MNNKVNNVEEIELLASAGVGGAAGLCAEETPASLELLAPAGLELLAPAGSEVCLRAAVSAGADAVYLGLTSFNARRGAENFTLDGLARACEYAHARGVRVYVTLNTIIFDSEMKEAVECARQAWRAGADAFIVQDIGFARELHRVLPQAPLHASTQMNIHTESGVRAAAALGCTRVTLARELSLSEIEHLACVAREENMSVEVFAHGAICVCYSGQCLMSSMIGGRSANRGRCAQPCRMAYELYEGSTFGAASNERGNFAATVSTNQIKTSGEHLLSPRDLCAADYLPALMRAGVSSFKIEGRMKSPEYVSAVVGVYRSVIDRVVGELLGFAASATPDGQTNTKPPTCVNNQADNSVNYSAGSTSVSTLTKREAQTLTQAFSRGFTSAYLEGARGNEMMSYARPNNRGASAGRITRVAGGAAYLKTKLEAAPGDIFEIWTNSGRCVCEVHEISLDKKGCLRLPLPEKREARSVRAGDRTFRVRSAAAAFKDNAFEPRIPVCGVIDIRKGKPLAAKFWVANELHEVGEMQTVNSILRRLSRAGCEGACGSATGDVVCVARTRAITPEDVRAHVDRLGQTPFTLQQLTINLDDNVGLGFSAIHKVRAEALDRLLEQLQQQGAGTQDRTIQKTEPRHKPEVAAYPSPTIAALVTNPACARAAKRAGADYIYVNAFNYKRGSATMCGCACEEADQAGYPKQCIIALPNIEATPAKDGEAAAGAETLAPAEATLGAQAMQAFAEFLKPEKPVLTNSFAALARAAQAGAKPQVGPYVPIVNTSALETAAALGATRVWLSPELTLAQIKDLTAQGTPVSLGITIIGTQELMTTKHCILMSAGACAQNCATCRRRRIPHFLQDKKGYKFPVVSDAAGISHIYNSVQLDTAANVAELMGAGVTSFMVDASLMNAEATAQAVGRAKKAVVMAQNGSAVQKPTKATTGHLFRGVE